MNNNYFDLGSKKFLIITLVILACFFLLIVKAFNDLSDAQANMENNQPQKQAAVDINNVMDTMPRPMILKSKIRKSSRQNNNTNLSRTEA